MAKDKALIHDLSCSISFGRLSLKGKVFWPLLIIKSDDQGRGMAESDALKWRVCPNVDEIIIDDIADIMQEMASDRIGLLHLYQDGRGRNLYQLIRWWEPEIGSGSYLQWARPSEYEAPAGWTDRVRLQPGRGKEQISHNWESPGGFNSRPSSPPQPDIPPTVIAGEPPSTVPTPITQLNITQPKVTNGGADAPPTCLEGWLELVENPPNGSNRHAVLRRMHEALFPGHDPPEYSKIGGAVKTVKGAGRLAQLLWQASGQRITGDPIAYALGMNKGGSRHAKGYSPDDRIILPNGKSPVGATPEEFYSDDG